MKTKVGAAPESRTFPAKTAVGVLAAAATLCAPLILAVPAASAAVPTFPDNIVVFPDRDMVVFEGFQDYIGKTGTVEIYRPGVGVVGSTQGEVAAGEVAFEINHPGGVCWGAGTNLKVTPDIKHGDEVSISFDGTKVGDTKLQNVYVTSVPVLSTTAVADDTVTVKGYIEAGFNPEQMEQRIIEPALKDTSVGRRDARAVVGGAGDDGYVSSLVVNGTEWTATYVFDEPAAAKIAANAGAGVRAMSWQVADVDGNRQGLTIAEFGEFGGPGMGNCPNGPLTSGPAAPTDITAAKTGDSIKLTWTPAQAIPGTPPITGYRVHAVSTTSTNGEKVEIGKRIDNGAAKGTTITGLDGNGEYDIRIVSLSSAGESFPAATVASPQEDTTAPTVAASLPSGSYSVAQKLVLTSAENGVEIYYTTDGSDVIEAGQPSVASKLFDAEKPIEITATTTVKFVAIDPSDNRSAQGEVTLTITDDPVPAKPSAPTAVAGAEAGTADVSWTAPDAGAPNLTISEYSVQAYKGDVKSGEPKKVAGTETKVSFTGLSGDTEYTFTVTASNTHGPSAESDKSAALTVPGALVANAGADQSITRKATASPVTLDGSKSTKNATYVWTQTGGQAVTLSNRNAASPTFSLPTVGAVTTQTALASINNPLVFSLAVTSGGQTRVDEVKVTPIPDRVTVGRAQWKSRDFRIEGTASTVGATVTVYRSNATGALTRISSAGVTAAAAPETGGVWSLRLRDNAAGTNPGTIYVVSNLGGTTTAPVTAG